MHIDDALKHVADFTPRQPLAVHNEMTKLCREVAESARGRGARPPFGRTRDGRYEGIEALIC